MWVASLGLRNVSPHNSEVYTAGMGPKKAIAFRVPQGGSYLPTASRPIVEIWPNKPIKEWHSSSRGRNV